MTSTQLVTPRPSAEASLSEDHAVRVLRRVGTAVTGSAAGTAVGGSVGAVVALLSGAAVAVPLAAFAGLVGAGVVSLVRGWNPEPAGNEPPRFYDGVEDAVAARAVRGMGFEPKTLTHEQGLELIQLARESAEREMAGA